MQSQVCTPLNVVGCTTGVEFAKEWTSVIVKQSYKKNGSSATQMCDAIQRC